MIKSNKKKQQNSSLKNSDVDIKKELKILIVGDREVGKTSLSLKYFDSTNHSKTANNTDNLNDTKHSPLIGRKDFNNNDSCVHSSLNSLRLNTTGTADSYVPTTLSVYRCDIQINFSNYGLSLTDTSGCRHNKKFVQLRRHYYTIAQDIDVIMMCFSLVDPISFSNVTKKWYPELREYYRDVPILLVGTKSDIKYQIKYQLKNSKKNTNKSDGDTAINNTFNTTTSIDTWSFNFKKKVNFLKEKQFNSNMLGSHLASTGASLGDGLKVHGNKCNYCNNLHKVQRFSGANILNNITKTQIEPMPSKPRAVSIVSKVSQQNILDILHNMTYKNCISNINNNSDIYDILNNQSIEQTLVPNIEEKKEVDFTSMPKFSPKLTERYWDRPKINTSVDSGNPQEKEGFSGELSIYNEVYDEYENLDIEELDGLIVNLKNELNTTYNTDKNASMEDPITENMTCENKSVLCQVCQKNFDEEEKKILATVAGNADFQTNTVNSILNENRNTDTEEVKRQETAFHPLNSINQRQKKESKQINEANSELDLKSICQTQVIKRKDCLKLKHEINAKKYMQCSSLDEITVKDVMDTAIELALEYHLQKFRKNKSGNTIKNHQTPIIDLNKTLNESMESVVNSLTLDEMDGIFKKNSNKNKLTKKFSNSTEYGTDIVQPSPMIANKDDSYIESELDELEKYNKLIVLPIDIEIPVERSSLKKNRQKSRLNKSSRSLSRCLSCTRANNNTSTSLNKI